MNTVDKVRNTIIKHRLINRGERVLVALSGGSDSVSMLNILIALSKEMYFSVCAAHLNHNIRAEAGEDERFVRELCSSYGIDCFVKSVDVTAYAKERSISTELAGREIRYAFFEELRGEKGIDKIATAHNKNDSAESILLHLIRGCGIDGLSGISPQRDNHIIRPIIDLCKSEIEEYCKANSLKYVVDKTNFKTDYTRNKIRLLLMPVIEKEINPNFVNTVTENADIFTEASEFLDSYSEKVYNNICRNNTADIDRLLSEDTAVIRCILQRLYCEYKKSHEKLSVKYINELINIIKCGENSKTINLPNKISARIEYGRLYFTDTEKKSKGFCYPLCENEEIFVSECGFSVIIKRENAFENSTKSKIFFYADDNSEFMIRSRQNGDIFFPVGMQGRKRISDLFCDMKIPSAKRDNIPLLLCNGEIVWVGGIRQDRRFLKGKRIMSCEIIKRSLS